jgi:Zn-dependent metalloprotease
MKKAILLLSALLTAQFNTAQNTSSILKTCSQIHYNEHQQLDFLVFQEQAILKTENTIDVLQKIYDAPGYTFQSLKKEQDNLGYTHEKFSVTYQNLTIAGAVIIVHSKAGKIMSINGQLNSIQTPTNAFRISKSNALQKAQMHLHIKKLKTDKSDELTYFRQLLNDPSFTFSPKIEAIIFLSETSSYNAYKVALHAEEPLFNGEAYINAQTGELLGQYNQVCLIDVPAVGKTQYNSTQNFTNDQFVGGYRLRESQRGQGIETYSLNNTTTFSAAVDVVNASPTWTTNTVDSTCIGVHWGTEQVYDYLQNVHSRNSIDNNGFKLISFVHYGNNFGNAFWNGQFMTYGDGNPSQNFRKMGSLDVTGHEVTHGLVQQSAGLGQGVSNTEANSLNEAWADIIGTSIERYTLPSGWDWVVGKDVTLNGAGIRNMQNPNVLSNPDTYGGTFWDISFANIHNNGCPADFWFYLLNAGGSGTNDLNNSYSVTAISPLDAEKIAFRALTVYFTPTTNYAAARLHTIQSAKDLFGACSNQVEQVIRAWYAVGVGSNYSAAANPNFIATNYFCTAPATTSFVNTTPYGFNYSWAFGDGSISSNTNPVHTYTSNGVYTVKLYATGCNNLLDSITKTAYINVSIPQTPTLSANSVSICSGATLTVSANGNNIGWYANPTASGTPISIGNNFTIPSTLTANTSYYATSNVTPPLFYGGILSNTSAATAGTMLNTGAHSLNFDVTTTCTLQSVVVYAQNAGSRVISLRNNANNLINSLIVALTPGANTLTLAFPLAVGQNYKLGLTASTSQPFFVSTSGVNFPYQIGGCVNINTSSLGNSQYPWFYNWEIERALCNSGIVPVNVTVNALPSVSLSANNLTVCPDANAIALTGSPSGGNYLGSSVSNAVFSPSIGAGIYPISYNYTDGNGCAAAAQISITVEACVSVKEQQLQNSISVYPNPAHHNCFIKNETGKALSGSLFDVHGKLLQQFTHSEKEFSFSVTGLAKGVYTLKLSDEAKTSVYYKIVVD